MRRLGPLAAALALVPGLVGVTAGPGHGTGHRSAAGPAYVALGDSYSSGVGTRTYLRDGTSCRRSVYAYPPLVASSRGYRLNFRACGGATVADVTRLQLSAVNASTAYVSVTVGGNDADFAGVLTTCAKPAWASNCNAAIDRATSILTGRLPGRLRALFAGINRRAPRATVVAAGYPRLFDGQDCNALTWFSPSEEARLNATADLLDRTIRTAAEASGFAFSSPAPAFSGHAICDGTEWVNGLSYPISDSYHPNRLGHSVGYAPLVATALGGSGRPVSPLSVQQAAEATRRLTAQQRAYAARDRTIRPRPFRLPDLSSPAIRRAAVRAGVDLSSRASIDAADRTYAARQARSYALQRVRSSGEPTEPGR